ncbi:MAG: phage terminase large subunit [Bacteroidota bacterium]|nr:phage terminase large subunit [Bacteroidota bacterium]
MDKEIIKREAKKELARREFFFYCHFMSPDFYKKDREYLVSLCNTMQEFIESEEDVLIINLPPRHGKSRTATMFVEWLLGRNSSKKIMTGSYNETLSTVFSKAVRNTISEIKADPDRLVYNDIFPDIRIKKGDGAMNLWSLEGQYSNYLATSPTGTATGFGADIIIIDDLIKNAEEANNENILEKHWEWFTNTMLSRLEANGKIIIIMTRWHSNDLAGRAREYLKESGYIIKQIKMKALTDTGYMLCDEILSKKEYEKKVKTMGIDIASANYQQEPIDLKGKLYTSFKTYNKINFEFERICSYTDTADMGIDYLCSIIYGVYNKEAYILDVYYTKEGMEITEKEVAKRHFEFGVNLAIIESNNGGRGFARNIDRILKTDYQTNACRIMWFHQSKNKISRIISNSTWVMDHIYFPINWKNKWSEYYNAMNKYQKEGKNKYDDAPDATTGVAERTNVRGKYTL